MKNYKKQVNLGNLKKIVTSFRRTVILDLD